MKLMMIFKKKIPLYRTGMPSTLVFINKLFLPGWLLYQISMYWENHR